MSQSTIEQQAYSTIIDYFVQSDKTIPPNTIEKNIFIANMTRTVFSNISIQDASAESKTTAQNSIILMMSLLEDKDPTYDFKSTDNLTAQELEILKNSQSRLI